MRYLTHRDQFVCIHGGVVTFTVDEDSLRCTVGGNDGRILLEEEVKGIELANYCTAQPPVPKCCKVLAIVPNNPDKFRINGKRPVVEGALILTNNGPLLHSQPDGLASQKFAMFQPLLTTDADDSSQSKDNGSPAEESEKKNYLIHVQCRLNGDQLLASRPYRILIDGQPAIEGKSTDVQGVIKENVELVVTGGSRAYIEVESPSGGAVIFGVHFIEQPMSRPSLVANLGFDPGASQSLDSFFSKNGESCNRDWLGETELAVLELDREKSDDRDSADEDSRLA
ncbi:hypothetical protein LOC67_09140 [Stieleria sp. JC731]|uniref:hypothetical protein n=1 Tax=Pirellulaceae TaxID=2691357 RepID=UPI001E2969F3|nr:hypothetical protein [Stieleria sp. JC731]MCC9600727.1 hypothetical protein [Stieleria sp. JC731]